MGVVYLGHDTRLDRDVAIKALPEHLAQDPERLRRFEREAKTLATLTHPNVAGIYGVEEHEGRRYLILEYVEGETLADRLDRGALPVDEALEVCAAIATGVEAAHEAGVIHRDLKPGNIIITPDGKVKALDFGLAKTEEGASSSSLGMTAGAPESPTRTTPNTPTMPGVILGTAPYMSPEQARGRKVDARTDVWSFGCVLYECLTGASPFQGESATDSIGAILHKEVDYSRLPVETPASVRRLLRRCLTRDKRQRLQSIADARVELEAALAGEEEVGDAASARGSGRRLAAGLILGLVIGAFLSGVAWIVGGGDRVEDVRAVNLDLSLRVPDGSGGMREVAIDDIAIAPDGSAIVVAPIGFGPLVVRELDSFETYELEGTDDAYAPTFSPDGRQIAFRQRGRIMRVARDGGPLTPIAESSFRIGGLAWSEDGHIYSTAFQTNRIIRVQVGGGEFETVVRPDESEDWIGFDSTHVVPGQEYLLTNAYFGISIDAYEIVATWPDGRTNPVLRNAAYGMATADGRLLFLRDSSIYVAEFDAKTATITGQPERLIDGVRASDWGGHATFAVARDGTLVYAPGKRSTTGRRLVRVNLNGEVTPLSGEDAFAEAFRVSPDGKRVALTTLRRSFEAWVYEIERGTMRQITSEGEVWSFAWSNDSKRLAYNLARPELGYEKFDVLIRDLERGGPAEVFRKDVQQLPTAWAPDDDAIIVESIDDSESDVAIDLRAFSLSAPSGEPLFVIPNAADAAISPDGKWMAHFGKESDKWEIYVRAYPPTERVWQVSFAGQAHDADPMWAPDGSAIYWVESDWLVGASFGVTENGPVIGAPERLFASPWPHADSRWESWDITPEGDFVAVAPAEWEQEPARLRVMMGWGSPGGAAARR